MKLGDDGSGSGDGGHAGATYRGLRSRRTTHALGEINVVPLVDVVLVLLLVFMITAPMMSRGIDVALPRADQPDIEPEDRLTVSIRADGRIFLGDQPVNILLLEDQIRGMLSQTTAKLVYLRADEALRYGQVIEVVDKLKTAGAEQIGFVYQLPEEPRPR